MIRVAGIWELGWNTPLKEIELWEFPLRDFGVERFYMTPISGIASNAVTERAAMEEVLSENSDMTIVFVDERAPVSLTTFVHPENALYVFGKASLSSMVAYGRTQDRAVKIDTVANAGLLWPHQAAAIVLYDRMLKTRGT